MKWQIIDRRYTVYGTVHDLYISAFSVLRTGGSLESGYPSGCSYIYQPVEVLFTILSRPPPVILRIGKKLVLLFRFRCQISKSYKWKRLRLAKYERRNGKGTHLEFVVLFTYIVRNGKRDIFSYRSSSHRRKRNGLIRYFQLVVYWENFLLKYVI